MKPLKRLARLLAWLFTGLLVTVVLMFITLAVAGGGFGEKQHLPSHLVHRDCPLIFAHRGATAEAPENSRAAMLAARQVGFPGVEVDVRPTADKVYLLFHDETTDRLLGREGELIATPSDEVLGGELLHNGRPSGEHPLPLERFCREFGPDFIIYLDFKRSHQRNYPVLARFLDDLLRRHALYDRVIVANGNIVFITYLEYAFPHINTCLEGVFPSASWLYPLLPRRFKPDFIAGFDTGVTKEFAEWLKASGMNQRAIVYHIGPHNIGQAMGWGINKLIAGDGDYLRPHLECGESEL